MTIKFTILYCICIGAICEGYRSDSADYPILSLPEGEWGVWSNTQYCDEGDFSNGFWLNVGDSTIGACAFALHCGDYDIRATDNEFADDSCNWSNLATCPSGSYVVGFQTKVEESQGTWGDDSALNSVRVICSDDTELYPSIQGADGSWGTLAKCDAKQSVCGFKQKVEASSSDDTALNAIELFCCDNTKTFSNAIGYWERIGGLGGGGILTVESTIGVTKHTEKEVTQTFGTSVTNTVSLGLEFEGLGIGGSKSHTMSSEIAQKTVQDVSSTYEEKLTFQCEEGAEAMYQWIIKMTEDAMTETFQFEIKSNDRWCISDNQLTPQCPFGFCRHKDSDCQVCTYDPTYEPTPEPSRISTTSSPTTSNSKISSTTNKLATANANDSSSMIIYLVIGGSVFTCIVLIIIGCIGAYICYTRGQKKNFSADQYVLLEGPPKNTAIGLHNKS